MTRKIALITLLTMTGSLLLAAVGGAIVRNLTHAEPSVNWFAEPHITKVADLVGADIQANRHCQPVGMKVIRGMSSQTESGCVVHTAYGDVDIARQLVRPANYGNTYTLDSLVGGNPIISALPGRDEALSMTGAGGNGVNLGVYDDMYAHIRYKIDVNLATGSPYAHYVFSDPADRLLRYDSGEIMRFNPFTLSHAANGRFVLVDTIYNGFALIDMDTHAMRPVSPSIFYDAATGNLFSAVTAVDNSGSFAAVAYNMPGGWGSSKYLNIVDVHSCSGTFGVAAPQSSMVHCSMSDIYGYLKRAVPGLEEVRDVQFVNDHAISVAIQYSQDGVTRYARYGVTAAQTSMRQVAYEALGDSYTSGEGAFHYRQGTDTTVNRCHQSSASYPYLLASRFDSFASLACSGARMRNISGGSVPIHQTYATPSAVDKQLAMAQRMPGVVSQQSFVIEDNPEVVTVSIAGNDIGFGDILARCVHPLQKLSDIKDKVTSVETCYRTYEDRLEVVNTIDAQFTQLRTLFADLVFSSVGPRRVYVMGYPQIAKVGGDCGVNVQMNDDEIIFARDLISYLDGVIKQAAGQAGAYYVDIEQSLVGHRLCETRGRDSAVNGFTVDKSDSLGYNFTPSFHPTALGQQLIAQSIAEQTDNLTAAMPTASAQTDGYIRSASVAVLQNVSRTNRAVRAVKPYPHLVQTVLNPRTPVKIVLGARDMLLKVAERYSLVANSQTIQLGTAVVSADGVLQFDVILPDQLEPGMHTLHVYGNDIFGNAIDIQQTFFLTVSADDYDGDGIANSSDQCDMSPQSGRDDDNDGIDDACDADVAITESQLGVVRWFDDAILELDLSAGRRS